MNKFIAIVLIGLIFGNINAQNIHKDESAIEFSVKNLNLYTVNGYFAEFIGNINFTPMRDRKGTIDFSIDIATINTGIKKRDKMLQAEKYFDTDDHPYIQFQSSDISIQSDSTFTANGTLSIKGITKQISVPFAYNNNHYKGEFTLQRLDYNVGGNGTFLIDNDVNIVFSCIVK